MRMDFGLLWDVILAVIAGVIFVICGIYWLVSGKYKNRPEIKLTEFGKKTYRKI